MRVYWINLVLGGERFWVNDTLNSNFSFIYTRKFKFYSYVL